MEGFVEAVGIVALVLLIAVGLASGYIAGRVAGRNMPLYLVAGVLAALVTPFLLAALGLSVLAAGGLLLLLAVAAVGALIVLVAVRAVVDRRG
ncbi:hypothetical protein [Roseivivax isoporae]|uniref:GlsB/YeaQ/YmgE family stress response membrane protein n=1 Tax=Roseivivax isoporae LMG 25204 TaxID=1449351 RepID=X7F1T8_9RHOB|nr:hypothetical protein [Roseivivax isoporae]ETX26882.1 hypothetical protein RISW2_18780 [Roseivivax isoporae LMG 25204]